VKTSFGIFKRPPPKRPEYDLSYHERQILKAFQKGQEAGRSDAPKNVPYRFTDEQAKFEAWILGYAEEAQRYVVAEAEV
jgi:hypothetical protein